ncbi:MAG: PDZ domain-containing protein [Acidobacteriota bacterium]
MDRRELNNGVSNFAPDTEGGDVAAMLNALPRVDAPENFEFRVKARIAEGSAPRATLIPFLKIAAPLSLVLLIGAFVAFYGLLPKGTDVPAVIDTARNEPASTQPPSELTVPPVQTVPGPLIDRSPETVQDEPYVATGRPAPARRRTDSEFVKSSQGGSLDFSLNAAKPKLPPGFESVESRNMNSNTNSSAADVPVRNVLGILGITADFVSGGWKVRSVVENSVASRAGVQAADVVEAIDGQQMKSDSKLKGGAKTFTIRRDGKLITLTLTN